MESAFSVILTDSVDHPKHQNPSVYHTRLLPRTASHVQARNRLPEMHAVVLALYTMYPATPLRHQDVPRQSISSRWKARLITTFKESNTIINKIENPWRSCRVYFRRLEEPVDEKRITAKIAELGAVTTWNALGRHQCLWYFFCDATG